LELIKKGNASYWSLLRKYITKQSPEDVKIVNNGTLHCDED